MIKRFQSQAAEALFRGQPAPEFEGVRAVALRVLDMLQAAHAIHDIPLVQEGRCAAAGATCRIPLDARWRLCFVWTSDGPDKVGIVDGDGPDGHPDVI